MKPFSVFLEESEEPIEFAIKILVRGREGDAYKECHPKCQWLNMEETPKCVLFKGSLAMNRHDNGASHPLRNSNCTFVTEGLT